MNIREGQLTERGVDRVASFTFNGIRNEKIKMTEGRQKGPFAPITRNFVRYGKAYRLKSSQRELLEIIQPIAFKASTEEEAMLIQDELSSWLVTKDISPLILDDEPGRTYWCVVDGTIENFKRKERSIIWEGSIRFLSKYTSGRVLSLPIGTTFANHTIGSKVETPWKSRTVFSGAISSFTIENDQSGKVICQYGFISNDVLEIDYKKRKVTLNGEARPSILLMQSNWFDLKPGVNRLKASQPSTVTYDELFH